MAPSSSVTTVADQLILSLGPHDVTGARLRKVKDAFMKAIRSSSYVRTNQFEVAEKLDGFEEKFQILNCDDISDALHTCRVELKQYQDKFLPDVLDFLLRISSDPVKNVRSEHLENLTLTIATAPAVKWSDIEVTSPIDHSEGIWRVEEYSDFSSDEDSFVATEDAAATVLRHARFRPSADEEQNSQTNACVFENVDASERFVETTGPGTSLSELQIIREALFLLQGFPTGIFRKVEGQFQPRDLLTMQQVTPEALQGALTLLCQWAQRIQIVRTWLKRPQEHPTMQLMQELVFHEVSAFDRSLSDVQRSHIDSSRSVVISLLRVNELVHDRSAVLGHLAHILQSRTTAAVDLVELLDAIHSHICLSQAANDVAGVDNLIVLFLAGLEAYMRPILHWMNYGKLLPELGDCFIVSGDHHNPAHLWQEWYRIDPKAAKSCVPNVIRPFLQQILTRGKTVLFLHRLSRFQADDMVLWPSPIDILRQGSADLLSFSEVVRMSAKTTMQLCSDQASTLLYQTLEQQLQGSLADMSKLYLGQDGAVTALLDIKVFRAIDACDEAWNDRFLIADLFETVLPWQTLKTGRLAVHSLHTSSRNMASRRQSVRILGDLSIEYTLPWPIANIIPQPATKSYRRLGLLLSQVRRAKYVLERRARHYVMNNTIDMQRRGQVSIQATFQKLLIFVNTWYSHMTTLVVETNFNDLLARFRDISSIDDMIRHHERFISNVEHAFLLTKNLKTMHDSLMSILDLCIRFSDLAISTVEHGNSDFETRSFVSAASRKRRWKSAREDSSGDGTDDNDDDEESANEGGYSTFTVPKDSSTADELNKIASQFDRHLAFLVAGLRGLVTTAAEGSHWALLAQQLDWKHGG